MALSHSYLSVNLVKSCREGQRDLGVQLSRISEEISLSLPLSHTHIYLGVNLGRISEVLQTQSGVGANHLNISNYVGRTHFNSSVMVDLTV